MASFLPHTFQDLHAELTAALGRASDLEADRDQSRDEGDRLGAELGRLRETEAELRQAVGERELELAQGQQALRDASLRMTQQVREV